MINSKHHQSLAEASGTYQLKFYRRIMSSFMTYLKTALDGFLAWKNRGDRPVKEESGNGSAGALEEAAAAC